MHCSDRFFRDVARQVIALRGRGGGSACLPRRASNDEKKESEKMSSNGIGGLIVAW